MADRISVLIPESTLDAKIKEIGEKISSDYAGKEVHLICSLKGGVFFACELAKRITVPVSLDFMQVSSYGDGTKSSGIVRIKKDLDDSLEGKEVIIVEDIIDTGKTLHYLIPLLFGVLCYGNFEELLFNSAACIFYFDTHIISCCNSRLYVNRSICLEILFGCPFCVGSLFVEECISIRCFAARCRAFQSNCFTEFYGSRGNRTCICKRCC